jgi:hypothetical protein
VRRSNRVGLTLNAMLAAGLMVLVLAGTIGLAYAVPPGEPKLTNPSRCPLGEAIKTGNQRRLAVVIGVATQVGNQIFRSLDGPVNDAEAIYALLTGPNGYGFPRENVCLLLEEDATFENVISVFELALVQRAEENDTVVLYFAGHGSQFSDIDGDEENDAWDETLVLYGADGSGMGELVDDDLRQMLESLQKKTSRITVILDSCHSGTGTREKGSVAVRGAPAHTVEGIAATNSLPPPLGTIADELSSDLVVLAAAADGTAAYEEGGGGIFTSAFIAAASRVHGSPVTYQQILREVRQLTAAHAQIPDFSGDLSRYLFDNTERRQPLSWEVLETTPSLRIGGVPFPGFGIGAILRVYDGNADYETTNDPSRSKAVVKIDAMSSAITATVQSVNGEPEDLQVGDIVVLQHPGTVATSARVRILREPHPAGLSPVAYSMLMSSLNKLASERGGFSVVNGPAEFEIGLDKKGLLQISGPNGVVRFSFGTAAPPADSVGQVLWLFGLQRQLLTLQGEPGDHFVNNETLRTTIIPVGTAAGCSDVSMDPVSLEEIQTVPICMEWRLEVAMAPSTEGRLRVGAVLLASDGSIYSFTGVSGQYPILSAEQKITFRRVFVTRPPGGVLEHILVFGTPEESEPVLWQQLEHVAGDNYVDRGALYKHVLQLIGIRDGSPGMEEVWTTTHMPILVQQTAPVESAN